MKNYYLTFALSLFLLGCSTDENNECDPLQQPSIEMFSIDKAAPGDVIEIIGTNFKLDQDYWVLFNGVEGQVLEVTPTILTVEIPEGATSGDIELSYRGKIQTIGIITIETGSPESTKLYASKDFPGFNNPAPTQFIEIDAATGEETFLLELETTAGLESLVYDEENDLFFGVASITDENNYIDNQLYTIDIASNEFAFVPLEEDFYYELSVSVDGILYGIKDAAGYTNGASTVVVEIDPATGKETEVLDLQTTKPVETLIFDNHNTSIIGIRVLTDEVNYIHNELIKIDLSKNSIIPYNLKDDSYYQLLISDEGQPYGIRDAAGNTNPENTVLVEIDISNGDETAILDLETTSEIESLVFDNETERIIGVQSITDENDHITNNLFIIEPATGNFEVVNIEDEFYYYLGLR